MLTMLSVLIFVTTSVLTFTLPGAYLLSKSKNKFSQMEFIFVGTTIGFVIFTLLSYLLTLINLNILLIPIYLLFNILTLRSVFKTIKTNEAHSKKKFIFLAVIFLVGIIGQLTIIAPSGLFINGNVLFWSSNGHDGTWHIALMEEIKRGWPFMNPVFSGERLVNYHFFSDVAPAMFSKYLGLDNKDLYFRFFPILYSILLGSSVFLLVKRVTNNFSASLFALFFTYFAGSFGFIATYLKNGSIGGESIFWATQVQSASGNPPQIISDFLVLTYLYFFFLLVRKKDKILFALSAILLGSLALFKIYAALVLLGPTLLVGLWILLRKRDISILALGGIGSTLAAALYLPNATTTTGFLIFEPWWYIRTMIVEPSRLDWLDHELRRQTYIYEHNWKRVVYLETIGFFIFLFGNLGTRALGLLEFAKNIKSSFKDSYQMLFTIIVITSFVMPLLFLQKGVASNTSQFLQYFELLFGIIAAVACAKILKAIKPILGKLVFVIVLIVISVPTQLGLIHEFYSRAAYAKITPVEIEALNYLKDKTDDSAIVLAQPYDQYFSLKEETPQIWDWYDTSYISAFTSRRMYFADREQVDIMGYDFEMREKLQKEIFLSDNVQKVTIALHHSGINYLYFPKVLAPKVSLEALGKSKVFENSDFEIWKI